MRKLFRSLRTSLHLEQPHTRGEWVQYWLTIVLQAAFIVSGVYSIIIGQWFTAFVSVGGMVSIWMPLFLARSFRIRIPIVFEFGLTLFIYASIYLGSIQGFYTTFWWWDILLHTGSGLALGMVGFLILYSIEMAEHISLPPWILSLFSFSFAVALGALWEIFEFAMDSLFGFRMQVHGITDTMWDLIVDALGALVAACAGYFYVRSYRKTHGAFARLISWPFRQR